ncbi:hypothetical protein [Paenibacillus sp. GXUN7292]|uniref:hypothetical protein n=1 Tax=Paenibacillus sp. GXUN7292 TaxID=3422499 RepID=UPI003D7F1702
MITPLVSKCEQLGKGLDPEVLNELRMKIITPQIEEQHVSDQDFSYFPIGHRGEARIFRISHGINGRLFIEIHDVEIKTEFPSLWQLTDDDRNELHASGVAYCYYGENLADSFEIIEEVKQRHLVLSQINQNTRKKKLKSSNYAADPPTKEKIEIWTYKTGPTKPFTYKLAVKAFNQIYDEFPLFIKMEGIDGAREAASKFILHTLSKNLTTEELHYLENLDQFRVMSCDDFRKSAPRCQVSWFKK